MAAITAWREIEIRDYSREDLHALASGATVYHGGWGLINGDGYIENAAGTVVGVRGVVLVNCGDDHVTATANGVVDNVDANCVKGFTNGVVTTLFQNTLTQSDVGSIAYVANNGTLTCNPIYGIYPVGKVIKYISATKGEVAMGEFFNGTICEIYGSISGGTTTVTPANVVNYVNPFGKPVIVKDFFVYINTAGSSAVGGYAGIATDTLTAGTNLIPTATGIIFGTTGLYPAVHAALTGTSDMPLCYSQNMCLLWTSSGYMSISTSSSVLGAAIVGYWKAVVERV